MAEGMRHALCAPTIEVAAVCLDLTTTLDSISIYTPNALVADAGATGLANTILPRITDWIQTTPEATARTHASKSSAGALIETTPNAPRLAARSSSELSRRSNMTTDRVCRFNLRGPLGRSCRRNKGGSGLDEYGAAASNEETQALA